MKETSSLIKSDFRRYRAARGGNTESALATILFAQGFWASCVYRFSHVSTQVTPKFFGRILRIVFMFFEKGIEITTGIRIPGECQIGKGLYIGHFGPIILNSRVVMGENCNLSQGVTIGVVQTGERKGVPKIGDRVYIGPNAIVIGNITIGNDAAIGAGAVVLESIPDCGVVAGNPGKLISRKGSFGLINFDNMDMDANRLASLQYHDKENMRDSK